ncbi:MAG: hypothetical protein JW775_04185 [Candidatus Aminicenantes bacterium]|nr:hypothetical protein [Candidatus Aminicenantes bacterium]
MRDRDRRIRGWLLAGAALALGAGRAAAAIPRIDTIAAGLRFENLTRTVLWKGDQETSRIRASLIAARAEFGLAKDIVVGLDAGLVLTDFTGLVFTGLPVSLQYGAAPLTGFAFGADVVAPLAEFSDFRLSGAGRFAFTFGMTRTWPLEGFAVEGDARGDSSLLEIAAGPRLAYLVVDRIVPYIEVWARWLRAGFAIGESLGDLAGDETKRLRGDLQFGAGLGADAEVTDRLHIQGKAGILPYAGGVDSLMSLGILYKF